MDQQQSRMNSSASEMSSQDASGDNLLPAEARDVSLDSVESLIPTLDQPATEEPKYSISELANAFSLFNKVSSELDKSYQRLELQIAELNGELSTARKQQARELEIKNNQIERLESLVSILPSGVVILDSNSIVRDVNQKAIELLGQPLAGLSWSGVVARVAVPEVRSGFELKLRDGKILSLTSRDLNRGGERVILITEVTSIHETQERTNRDKRLTALGEMAASLAHQIRTPLSSSMLYMSQLALDELPPESRQSMADKVQDRLAHMSGVIDSMLSFVRGAKPQIRAITLTSLIEKIQDLVRIPAEQADATVIFQDVDPWLMIHADNEVLAGALMNLIMNAIQMTQNNPWVSVTVTEVGATQLEIKIADNGPGIATQHLEKIFDPFFTTRVQGTGLGLAVAAMTISAHDGDIGVRNRDTGGAEFTIRLPRINARGTLGRPSNVLALSTKEVA